VLHDKNIQETYLEKTAQIKIPHNMCGATLTTRYPHCFNACFMWKQRELFYQHNLSKKKKSFSILPNSRC
jgi:hypothetical protein